MKKENSADRRKYHVIFFIYLLIVVRLIIFKYPLSQLAEIARGWGKGVVLHGLDTANFTLFKTIRMYIDYSQFLFYPMRKYNLFDNRFYHLLFFL